MLRYTYTGCLVTQVRGLQEAESSASAADGLRVRKLETSIVTCEKYWIKNVIEEDQWEDQDCDGKATSGGTSRGC